MGFWNGFCEGFKKGMEEGKEKRLNSASYQADKAEIELANKRIKDLFEERRNNNRRRN
jgi:hypothetical protein